MPCDRAWVVAASVSRLSGGSRPPADGSGNNRQLDEISLEELRLTLKGYPGDWRNDTGKCRDIEEPPREKALPKNPAGIGLVPPGRFDSLGNLPLRRARKRMAPKN